MFMSARLRLVRTVQTVREGTLSSLYLLIYVAVAIGAVFLSRWVRNTRRTKAARVAGGRWFYAGVILIALAIIAAIAGGIAWASFDGMPAHQGLNRWVEAETFWLGYVFLAVGSSLLVWGIVCLVVYHLKNESAKRAVRHGELMDRLAGSQPQATALETNLVNSNQQAGGASSPDTMLPDAHGPRNVSQKALIADELTKLAALVDKGLVTRDEFERQKEVLLGTESRAKEHSMVEEPPTHEAPVSGAPKQLDSLPNVVGQSFDVALRTMRSAGYLQLRYSDMTGQRRQPVTLSDWVVVGQRPEHGTCLPQDQPVTLGVKLAGE